MNLVFLLQKNAQNFAQIYQSLIQEYPDQVGCEDSYRQVFQKLQQIKPEIAKIEDQVVIRVEKILEDPDFEPYVNVDGVRLIENAQANNQRQALEFTPWKYWLASEIALEDVQLLGEAAYLAHILFEMTFIDDDETAIKEAYTGIIQMKDDYIAQQKRIGFSSDKFLNPPPPRLIKNLWLTMAVNFVIIKR